MRRGGRDGPPLGLSLDKFIKTGANDAAFHRKRKREAFYEKAKVVNRYKRFLRHEGEALPEHIATKGGKGTTRVKKKTYNPMESAKSSAGRKAERDAEKQKTEEERAEEKERKVKRRKRETKKLQKRTRRGQPIMKYQINSIVDKLLKERQAE